MSIADDAFVEYLSTRYPPTLSVREVSEITSEHEQTIRNKVSKGAYPIPSFTLGRKRLFRLIDVAAYIGRQCAADTSHPLNQRPKRGRPTKVQQLIDKLADEDSHALALARRTLQREER